MLLGGGSNISQKDREAILETINKIVERPIIIE
jgi:hypothetical protein